MMFKGREDVRLGEEKTGDTCCCSFFSVPNYADHYENY
jgi:hypothetical protein